MSDPIYPPDDVGEPLDPQVLQDFAVVGPEDAESAALWWDTYANAFWVGALDGEPTDE